MSRLRADRIVSSDTTSSVDFPNGLTAASLNSTDGTFSGKVSAGSSITATSFYGTDGTFSGNLNVAGVLTYDDVTNIDSVGLVTARSGIIATGIVTATSFHGDGSALSGTGIAGVSTTGHTTLNTLVSAGSTFKGDVYFATAGTPLPSA